MATTSKSRASATSGGRTRRAVAAEPEAKPNWLRSTVESVQTHVPRMALADRLQREILGVALILAGMLSGWALARGEQDGRLVAWWRDVLVGAYGPIGGWLVPLFVLLTAARILRDPPGPILTARHYVGGFGFAIAVVGLLQLRAVGGDSQPGGNLGLGVTTVALDTLGEVAGGVVLYTIGTVSVFLLADLTFGRFAGEVRRLSPSPGLLIPIRNGRREREHDAQDQVASDDDDTEGEPVAIPQFSRRERFARMASRALPIGTRDEQDDTPGLGDLSSPLLDAIRGVQPRGEPEIEAVDSLVARDEPLLGVVAETVPVPVPVRPEPVINVPQREAKRPKQAPLNIAAAIGAVVVADDDAPLPLPEIDVLPYYEAQRPNTADLEAKARTIQEKLASFRVEAWVREINTGPAVTQFALEPGSGVKVRRITELQNDLALALAAPQVRIEAPVPGMARVGVEVPNDHIMTVGLRETLESASFINGKQKLPIPLGLDVNGKYVVHDLAKMPHLLIAGATGSGKSVCLNGIISTFLLTRRPDELRMLMIDPKMVELTGYNGVPHLQCPVVTEMDKVVPALRLVLREMERRYNVFSQLGVRNLDGYRLKTMDTVGAERMPYLVVIIDELSDLMMTTPDEVESLLVRLTQMARATGIHLIIATQRPSVDVLTGLIKANVPARAAFMVSSGTDSRVILDMPGAERLLGQGDMLFKPPDAAKPQRIQGAYASDSDVQAIVDHWHAVTPVPHYAQEWLDLPSSSAGGDEEDDDPLWDQALEIVRKQGTASASMLQRRLRVGYNRAARIIQRMEDEEIIGPADGLRGRPVLLEAEGFDGI